MRTITKEYNIYTFNELSEEAKGKVKEWYLEGQEEFIFTENCLQGLENLFGKNSLEVQYSLGSCQGDGLNIYGEIEAEAIFSCLENHNGGQQLEQFENALTDREKKTILAYAEECGKIQLPMNSPYCYSLASRIDIAEDWEWQLETYSAFNKIEIDVLKKFEKVVRNIFSILCDTYESWGYEYFYKISDEDLAEHCEANEYEFFEDGTLALF